VPIKGLTHATLADTLTLHGTSVRLSQLVHCLCDDLQVLEIIITKITWLITLRTVPARRDCNPVIPNFGIPAEFFNPVIPGLAASNPGILGLKNCPLNAYVSVIK